MSAEKKCSVSFKFIVSSISVKKMLDISEGEIFRKIFDRWFFIMAFIDNKEWNGITLGKLLHQNLLILIVLNSSSSKNVNCNGYRGVRFLNL